MTWYLAGGTLVNAYEPSPFVSSVAIPEFPPVEVSSVTFAPAMAGVRTESARVTLPEMPPGVAAMLRLTVGGVPFDVPLALLRCLRGISVCVCVCVCVCSERLAAKQIEAPLQLPPTPPL